MVHDVADRLSVAHRRRDFGRELCCVRKYFGVITRRFKPGHGAGSDHPGVVLVSDHCEHPRPARSREVGDHVFFDDAGRYVNDLTGVGELYLDLVLRWASVAELLEEDRRAGPTSGGVDDEVSCEGLLMVGRAVDHPHPVDTPAIWCRGQTDDIVLLTEGHLRNHPNSLSHIPFQHRTTW